MLELERDGAAHLAGAAAPFLGTIERVLTGLPEDHAGLRLHGVPGLAEVLDALRSRAAQLGGMRPVRAILFDKSEAANWALGWHQDRTIAVRSRADLPGFGPWSVKSGIQHVEPPFAVIEAMRTIRVHLDPVPETNGPLRIVPGSHRLGKVSEREIDGAVARLGTTPCLAVRGDIWLYATPILHASAAARQPQRRRVLQVDWSADALPPPLEWLGI